MLKLAFLGAWHSHAVMHVREAAERPEEFELVGMYDADAEVIKRNQEKWEEYGLDIPVFETIEEVLGSEAGAVVVEGHMYQNLDYVEQAINAQEVLVYRRLTVDKVPDSTLDTAPDLDRTVEVSGVCHKEEGGPLSVQAVALDLLDLHLTALTERVEHHELWL